MKPFVPRPEPPLFAALATFALLLPVAGAGAQEPPAARSSPLFAAAASTPAAPGATPAPDAPAAAPETAETEIVATQGADFDSRGRIASFNGAVHVADPRFELWCDKLTVYLNKAAEKKGEPPPVLPDAAAGGDKKDGEVGGIDRAVAEGHVVIIQHKAIDKSGRPLPETGAGAPKTSVGRAERAEFKNKTGEMTLTGSPRVQQDINEHVGAPGTTMILGRDSTLKTFGASRTVIRQKPDVDGGKKKDKPPADAGTPPRRRG